jgi:2-methylcitrate dehydratase PrpD
VDAALLLRSEVKIEDIASIDCPLSPRLHHMVSGPARPETVYAAMFSVPYVVALAFVTGQVDLAAFHDMGISNPDVLALAERISCSEDKQSDFPVHFPGELRVTLKDGTVLTRREATSTGTPERALTTAEIKTKFMANATRVLDVSKAEKIVDIVNQIENLQNISELLQCSVV